MACFVDGYPREKWEENFTSLLLLLDLFYAASNVTSHVKVKVKAKSSKSAICSFFLLSLSLPFRQAQSFICPLVTSTEPAQDKKRILGSQIREVILDLLGRQLPEPRPRRIGNSLYAEQMVRRGADDA